MSNKPIFTIKSNSQKGGYSFKDILTPEVLEDVCNKLTGRKDFIVIFDDSGYNKGRLAKLEYQNNNHYISFSNYGEVGGRNSFFQSLTTALVTFYREVHTNGSISFYFLEAEGNFETNYHWFMYRLMATAGVSFINSEEMLSENVLPFITVDDLVITRDRNATSNRSNKSTYLTRNEKGITEIYAKTYGANKKEAVLIALAVSSLVEEVLLYEITEQNLTQLPRPDKEAILNLGNVNIITTDLTIEREQYEENNSLRSPRFIYNLLERVGPKKCALCECAIPEIIQGAHIFPVAEIKKISDISFDQKLKYATDGKNGIWLCQNHHKMFDDGIIAFDQEGQLFVREGLRERDYNYIKYSTTISNIEDLIQEESFETYMIKRQEVMKIDINNYIELQKII